MSKAEESWKEVCPQIWEDVFNPNRGGPDKKWLGEDGVKHFDTQASNFDDKLRNQLWHEVRNMLARRDVEFTEEDWHRVFAQARAEHQVTAVWSQVLTGFRVLNRYEREYSSAYRQINRARRAELVQLFVSRIGTTLVLAMILVGTYALADHWNIQLPMTPRPMSSGAIPAGSWG